MTPSIQLTLVAAVLMQIQTQIVVTSTIDPCEGTGAVTIVSAGPFAEDAGIQSLSASPSGGSWSGTADSNGNFDPSIGKGTHEVIYTYDFGNGCVKADTYRYYCKFHP